MEKFGSLKGKRNQRDMAGGLSANGGESQVLWRWSERGPGHGGCINWNVIAVNGSVFPTAGADLDEEHDYFPDLTLRVGQPAPNDDFPDLSLRVGRPAQKRTKLRTMEASAPISAASETPLFVSPPAPQRPHPVDTAAHVVQLLRPVQPPVENPPEVRSETIEPPFPWATDRRARIHRINYLFSHKLTKISGEVKCRKCERQYTMEYDLLEKFRQVAAYVVLYKESMHERAPKTWMNPPLLTCKFCKEENSVKPAIAEEINWLFLLLGQQLGNCNINQLRFFCKHNGHHSTGAKDRLLFLTYLDLCKQLDPEGPFNR